MMKNKTFTVSLIVFGLITMGCNMIVDGDMYEHNDECVQDGYTRFSAIMTIGEADAQTFTIGTNGTNESFLLKYISVWAKRDSNGRKVRGVIKSTLPSGEPDEELTRWRTTDTNIDTSYGWCLINFTSECLVIEKGITYAIQFGGTGINLNWYVYVGYNNTDSYTGGSYWHSTWMGGWIADTNKDYLFRVYGETINTTVDMIEPYEQTSSPLTITATGDSCYNNVTLYYRHNANYVPTAWLSLIHI